ncbi:MAG TPA: choice-of-anchor D domain-containing protein [Geobacteraceae bacterium]
MGKWVSSFSGAMLKRWGITAVILFGIFVHTDAQAFLVHVVDDDGKPITNGFRWLVMADDSYHVTPGQANPTPGVPESFTLGVNIHHSGAGDPVANGDTSPDLGNTASTQLADARVDLPKDQRYIVSVLPWHSSPPGTPAFKQTGWTMSGRNVDINQTDVTIVVHKFPVPTAQLTIIVFEDNQPTNAAYDQPQEHGLGGFDLLITDTVGKVLQDAWGNPIGTTYKYKCPINYDNIPFAGGSLTESRPAAVNPDGTCTNFPLPAESQPEYQIDPVSGAPVIDFKGTGVMTTCTGDTTDHPYPTAWTAYEMANCVEPYTTITKTVNGVPMTLLTPMGVGEAVVRCLPQNHYLIEPIPPANDPDWIGPTNTLEGGRANDNWARPGEPRFNITLGQLNWISFFGFVKACNNGPTGFLAAAPTATAPNGIACHGLDAAVTPPPNLVGVPLYTITGQIVLAHDQHAPLVPGLSPATPVPDCFVALNNLSGSDETVFTDACNADSTFTIRNVPPGTYQLATWDKAVNYIIDYRTIIVPATVPATGTTIDVGMVSIFSWFGILKGKVFSDAERTGTPWCQSVYGTDCPSLNALKPGVPNIKVNLRFTDGTPVYGTFTDSQGNYSFNQFFPFWRFLVAEVGPDRFKPTGMTAVADDGGDTQASRLCSNSGTACTTDVDCPTGGTCTGTNLRFGQQFTGNAAHNYPGTGAPYGAMGINPQLQPDGQLFRTDTENTRMQAVGPWVQDMQSRIDWGLDDFQTGENGSITGMISYDLTRTEEDPATDVLDGWEPGVPAIQVNLYKDLSGTGALLPGQLPIKTTFSTAWNDAKPTGCVSLPGSLWGSPQVVNGVALPDCAETFKTWNQVRPAPYDGYYTFDNLPIGKYIVQVVPPSEYRIRFWGDRDIEFGDPKTPFLEPPVACVGDLRDVPQYHTLFPDQQVPTDYPGGWFQGLQAPACDRKYADLTKKRSFVVNFGIFTDVPIPSRMWGTVWNDLMLEFNPNSPNAAGNLAVSWMPVTIKDYKGQELIRMYTDQWGHFEGLVPSNYDIAPPIPIGLVVSQYTVVANDPGPILDTREGSPTKGQMITDPFFNPAYGQEVIRENWPFLSGQTTFIDTIVIPNSAFVGNRVPINCDFLDHSPEIFRVDGPKGGPIVFETGNGPERITIQSVGQLSVNNPDFDPNKPISETNPAKIVRDHGFGATPGSVTVTYKGEPVTATVGAGGAAAGATSIPVAALSGAIPNGTLLDFVSNGTGALTVARLTAAVAKGDTQLLVAPLPTALASGDSATFEGNDVVTPLVNLQWAVDGKTIAATVPSGIKTGQLTVTRGDNGKTTTVGVTLHVNSPNIPVIRVSPPAPSCLTEAGGVEGCRPIQDAIDAAKNGSLILMAPGRYDENVIMWKPVQLQGYGAESTVIDTLLALANFPLKDQIFNELLNFLLLGVVQVAPGAAPDFVLEQGAGITVVGCDPLWTDEPCTYGNWFADPTMPKGVRPLIDGLTITGTTEAGGGIQVNSYAYNLKISNCEIFADQGSTSGGIRIGNAGLGDGTNNAEATLYNPTGSSFNPDVVVDHNRISQNGSLFGPSGGGISVYAGSDHYQITDNFICGNFSSQYGGGIGHYGLSVDRVNRNLRGVCGADQVPACVNPVNPAWPIQSYADRQIPNPTPRPNIVARNLIVSNESFDEGGGIHLAGELVPANANAFVPPQVLTFGAGPVAIYDNLIHGNKGGDDGGGFRTLDFNGEDVRLNPGNVQAPKLARLTADAAAGAITLTVASLSAPLVAGDTATFSDGLAATAPVNITVTAAVAASTTPTTIQVAALPGAIPAVMTNGVLTVLDFRKNQWYELDVFNNIIVDNSSADHGGGISLDNTVNSFVVNNTVANNDATSTSIGAFSLPQCTNDDAEGQFCPNTAPLENGGTAGFSVSVPQVGGIASFAHGTDLNNILQAGAFCNPSIIGSHPYNPADPATYPCTPFSNPVLQDNIIWHNRSFYWDSRINNNLGGLVQIPVRNGYWDMTVYGTASTLPASLRSLNPTYSLLTDGVGGNLGGNHDLLGTAGADPRFVTRCDQPFLGNQCQGFNQYEAAMKGGALGNFVATMFTPNGLRGDYHTGPGSSALDMGALFQGSTSPAVLITDFDGKPRPLGVTVDIGANEQLALNAAGSPIPSLQVLKPLPPPSPALPSLDFGTAALFRPVQGTVTITNYGQKNLIVAGVQVAGPNAAMFTVIDWTGMTTVSPGGTMTLSVSFTPLTKGASSATLQLVSNDPVNGTPIGTTSITLTGSGI